MKSQAKPALLIAMFIYLAWGAGLLFAPGVTHKLLTAKPLGAAAGTTLGVALLACAGLFLIAANEQSRELVRGSIALLGVLGLALLYQVLLGRNIPQIAASAATMVFTVGLAVDLFFTLKGPARATAKRRAPKKKKGRRR